MARTIHGYKTYNFKDKDPIIDQLRTLVEDSGKNWKDIADESGICKSTLYGWFQGNTLRPKFCTIMAVTRALGGDIRIVKHPSNVVRMKKSA